MDNITSMCTKVSRFNGSRTRYLSANLDEFLLATYQNEYKQPAQALSSLRQKGTNPGSAARRERTCGIRQNEAMITLSRTRFIPGRRKADQSSVTPPTTRV